MGPCAFLLSLDCSSGPGPALTLQGGEAGRQVAVRRDLRAPLTLLIQLSLTCQEDLELVC